MDKPARQSRQIISNERLADIGRQGAHAFTDGRGSHSSFFNEIERNAFAEGWEKARAASNADATVRAVATELLAALKDAEIVIAEVCVDQHPDNVCCHTLAHVRAAIAKAEGN